MIRVSRIKDGYDAVNGGAGLDRIEATTADTAISLTAVSGIETITANGPTGVFIRGNGAANVLDFSATTLTGIPRIEGGNGADTVIGSAGADTIVSGLGADRLTGGAGAYVFRFNLNTESRGAAFDTITDFTHLTDQIDLTAIDANTLLAGDQGFNFIGTAAFGHIAGELRMIIGGAGETRLWGISTAMPRLTSTSALRRWAGWRWGSPGPISCCNRERTQFRSALNLDCAYSSTIIPTTIRT